VIVRVDEVFLADFGISFSWENLTRATTTADSGKTLVYAAPEVVRVEPRNEAADVWSLGCVFFEMVTVLHGRPVADLRRHFLSVADTCSFQANVANLEPWAASLRSSSSSLSLSSSSSSSSSASPAPFTSLAPTSGIAFDWALRMLQPDPLQRATAAELFEDIARESALRRVPFCGTCCHGGDRGSHGSGESATDDDDAEDDGLIWGNDDTNDDGI